MNISEVFIRRPIATALLMAGVLLFGLVSYQLLPVAALPNVEFPTIEVTAQFPGANPTTMAETVATPLENQFTQIPGLAQMTSTSGLGQTTITLQFDLSVNINAAAGEDDVIRDKVRNSVRVARLPDCFPEVFHDLDRVHVLPFFASCGPRLFEAVQTIF